MLKEFLYLFRGDKKCEKLVKISPFFQMSASLKFDFQKRKQLSFSEVNYLNYTKEDTILHVTTTYVFLKTRGSKNKECTHTTLLKLNAISG